MSGSYTELRDQGMDFDEMLKVYESKEEKEKVTEEFVILDEEQLKTGTVETQHIQTFPTPVLQT